MVTGVFALDSLADSLIASSVLAHSLPVDNVTYQEIFAGNSSGPSQVPLLKAFATRINY